MIGLLLGHYRILEKIGAGGMGEVYRAHDERLDRDVALKVLPAGLLTDEAARKRFRNEALALSRLNHPNIATVHDFDSQGGVDFLVMELVEGSSLAQKLGDGPLLEKEIASLGAQIADALEDAHERGIIHRDLKPGNIMVTPKGRVKVLDFGLAKLLRQPSGTAATGSLAETRGIVGTLAYMAPEQLQGEPADARTDVHAAGAVLYEMACGKRAFADELPSKLIDAILHTQPVPPRAVNTRISPELQNIILKCLEKEPEHRYQSAKELSVDLRRLGLVRTPAATQPAPAPSQTSRRTLVLSLVGVAMLAGIIWAVFGRSVFNRRREAATPPQISSLAVLPLENLSGDPAQEYFADGMTDELITDLARLSTLRVISRTSVMQYKRTTKPLPQIAKELSVDGIVEGTVERAGDRVKIRAQLIEASSDRQIWGESYDRDLRDVFAMQDEVARAIAGEIRITLTPQERMRLASNRPVNPAAQDAYLKGRYYWDKRTADGMEKARASFQQAIEADPAYAQAYTGLADAFLFCYCPLPRSEVIPKAKAAAQKALQLDDNLADAHATLGFIHMNFDYDWQAAGRELQRAIALNSNYAVAHQFYAAYLTQTGHSEEAIREARHALELDPLSLALNWSVGLTYYNARQNDAAIGQFQKTLQMEPDYVLAHTGLGMAYEQAGRYEEAAAESLKAAALRKEAPEESNIQLARIYALAGKRTEALQIVRDSEKEKDPNRVPYYLLGTVYVALGDSDKALNMLEKAREVRDFWVFFMNVDPRLDRLRGEPRFQALLQRIGFPALETRN